MANGRMGASQIHEAEGAAVLSENVDDAAPDREIPVGVFLAGSDPVPGRDQRRF